MSDRYDLVVIGGGHNGLTAAALAAKSGRKTLVVERRDVLGGLAAGEEFHPGYRHAGVLHDTGAVRGWVVEALDLETHGLALRNETPPVLVPRREDQGLLLWREPSRAAEELAEIAPADAAPFERYREFLERIKPILTRFVDRPPPDLFGPKARDAVSLGLSALALRRLGKRTMMDVLRIAPMCIADWLEEWFRSDLVKAALAAPALLATYTGPRSPGTVTNLLLAECLVEKPLAGGPPALVAALEGALRAHGGEIRTGAEVERLLIDGERVRGVRLAGGEEISSAATAASCDPRQLFLRLLPPAMLSRRLHHEIINFRARGTTAVVHLALAGYPEFPSRPGVRAEAVRVGQSLEELERAFDAVKYRRFSERPILEIRVPSLETPALAPEGHHVFSILVHFVPHALDGGWGEEQSEKLLASVLDVLSDCAPGIRDLVVGHEISSPAALESRFALTGGHLFHGEHALDQLLVRPTPGCARYATPVSGLLLCGSGSHPGGGLTCAPGALAARALLAG